MEHEEFLRSVWREQGWALYTVCSGCGEMAHCAGKRRASMLCLACYDLTDEAANVAGQAAAAAA